MLEIQSIDLASWLKLRKENEKCASLDEIAKNWHEAFKSHGLVYLKNHGLSELYHNVCKKWLEFCQCDQSHKNVFSARIYGECGYNCVGKVSLQGAQVGTICRQSERNFA